MGCAASRHDGVEGSVTGKGRTMLRRRLDDILLRRSNTNLSKKQLLKDAPEDEPSHHNLTSSSEDSVKFAKVVPEPEKSKEGKIIIGMDKDEKIEIHSEIDDDDVESRLSCAEDALVCPRSPSFRFYCVESSSGKKKNIEQDEEKACKTIKSEIEEKERSASIESEIEEKERSASIESEIEEKERSASKKPETEKEECTASKKSEIEEEQRRASKKSEIEEEESKKSEMEEVDVLQTSDEGSDSGKNRKETQGRKFKRAMLKRRGKNFLKVKSFYNIPACGGHHEKTHLLAPKPVSS